jgi:opacity protein-like surface antigen
MKKMVFLFFAMIMATGGWGAIADAQMYFSGNLGVSVVDDADAFDGYDNAEISFDPGFTGTVAFGVSSGYGLRTEFELGYRHNELDDLTVRGYLPEPLSGNFSTVSGMGNILVDLMPRNPLNVFIGGGLGFANTEADFGYYGTDDDTAVAYQLMAGMSFLAGYNMWVDIQYRYFATDDLEFGAIETEYSTHNAMIGLRMNF